MSWGATEAFNSSLYDSHFNHAGVTYLASTGDSGAEVEWPAVSPYVVAVGGTTLSTQPDGTYVGETAWSGSGGGTSSYTAKPAYQAGFQTGSHRGVPDVAFDANPATGVPVYDTTGISGWAQYGGTSLSAPCWAGLFSLMAHSGPAWLYSEAAPAAAYSANYHDITTGSNGLPAGPGYDLVTGLGSPKANDLSGATPAIVTTSLPNGELTAPYSQTLLVNGGTSPYTWSITSGSLPAGLSLAPSTGLISGTPTALGSTSITFKVTDSLGGNDSKTLSLTVVAGPSITTSSLANGEVTAPYSQALTATAGTSPYTWSITSGTLPAGLALNASTGTVSGTPTTAGGPASITFKVTDAAGGFATRVLSITIISGPSITSASLPNGEATAPYSQTLAAGAGTSPYTWSTTSGTP